MGTGILLSNLQGQEAPQDEEEGSPRCQECQGGGGSSALLFLQLDEKQLTFMFVLLSWNGLHTFPKMFNKSRTENTA